MLVDDDLFLPFENLVPFVSQMRQNIRGVNVHRRETVNVIVDDRFCVGRLPLPRSGHGTLDLVTKGFGLVEH